MKGILSGVIDDNNQIQLLNTIIYIIMEIIFILKFMWDIQWDGTGIYPTLFNFNFYCWFYSFQKKKKKKKKKL